MLRNVILVYKLLCARIIKLSIEVMRRITVMNKCVRLSMLLLIVSILISGCCNARVGHVRKPLIGITSTYNEGSESSASTQVGFAYVRAVLQSGGAPVILPTIEDEDSIGRYIKELDGLVLIGGGDIPPGVYGQKPHSTVNLMSMERYQFERKLISQWLKSGKPILGICLGMQFANVISGGSLIQDIPSQVESPEIHRIKGKFARHEVTIDPDSNLADILKRRRLKVYSTHHQAVKKLGNNLKIVARSNDGLPEALERIKGDFGLFVQWHPEAMQPEHYQSVYGALVQACSMNNE